MTSSRSASLRSGAAAALAAALALLPAACGDSGGGDSSSQASPAATANAPATTAAAPAAGAGRGSAVKIADFKYGPPAIRVAAGTTVAWTNTDDAPHTATATADGRFDTGTIAKGQRKTATFSAPGTYAYICSFHPFMKGTVVVE